MLTQEIKNGAGTLHLKDCWNVNKLTIILNLNQLNDTLVSQGA